MSLPLANLNPIIDMLLSFVIYLIKLFVVVVASCSGNSEESFSSSDCPLAVAVMVGAGACLTSTASKG
ncbi:hypothetical protein AAC387_Pa06g0636 [Persea americana]